MTAFVYIVIRDLDSFAGPEVDVFASREAAEEHLELLGGEGDTRLPVREEAVADEAWAERGHIRSERTT
jgi:hypothetical protein